MHPQIMNILIYFPQTSQDFLHYLKVHDMFFQIMINSELFPANFTRINKFFLSLNDSKNGGLLEHMANLGLESTGFVTALLFLPFFVNSGNNHNLLYFQS